MNQTACQVSNEMLVAGISMLSTIYQAHSKHLMLTSSDKSQFHPLLTGKGTRTCGAGLAAQGFPLSLPLPQTHTPLLAHPTSSPLLIHLLIFQEMVLNSCHLLPLLTLSDCPFWFQDDPRIHDPRMLSLPSIVGTNSPPYAPQPYCYQRMAFHLCPRSLYSELSKWNGLW